MNPPKANGKSRDRIWLTRDLGKAAPDFWAYVEQSYQKQLQELPTKKITKITDYSHLTKEGTHESWVKSVEADPKKVFAELTTDILKYKTAKTEEELEIMKQFTLAKHTPIIRSMIPDEVLVDIFKEWLQDPYECSLKLGDERIAQLDKLSTRDAIKLAPMGDYYFNWIPTDRDQASETERKKIVKWWDSFVRIVDKTYLDELTKADIRHYTQTIVATAKKDSRSKTWISHRFGAIKNVINTYTTALEDGVICERIVRWFRDFPAPQSINGKTDTFDPSRLTKEQWIELLALVSDNCKTQTQKRWKAIVLFALNTCSYGIDCRNVLMSNIQGNELRMRNGFSENVA